MLDRTQAKADPFEESRAFLAEHGYPEGDIWWYHPRDNGAYIATARAHSQAQYQRARQRNGGRVPTAK